MAFLFDKKLYIELASEIPFPIVILMMEMLRIVGFSIYIYTYHYYLSLISILSRFHQPKQDLSNSFRNS